MPQFNRLGMDMTEANNECAAIDQDRLDASQLLALMSGNDFSVDIDLNDPRLEEDQRDTIPVPGTYLDTCDTIPAPRQEEYVDPFQESQDWQDIFFDGARRCPRHPGVKTSTDDGMFDMECNHCEAEQDEYEHAWQYDRDNDRRLYCGNEPPYIPNPSYARGLVACVPTEEDNIPF